MANPSSGNLIDTSVKLILILLISLVSFAVGTFVGKSVSESEYRRALLEMNEYRRFQGEVVDNDTFSTPEGLSEEEINHLTKEFLKAEKGGLKTKKLNAKAELSNKAKATKKKAQGEGRKSRGLASRYEQKKHEQKKKSVAKNKKSPTTGIKKSKKSQKTMSAKVVTSKKTKALPISPKSGVQTKMRPPSTRQNKAKDLVNKNKKKTHRSTNTQKAHASKAQMQTIPASLASNKKPSEYTIQVASYNLEKHAKEHSDRLKAKGYSAFYEPAQVKNRMWYRVQVGRFKSLSSAKEYEKTLKSGRDISSTLVRTLSKK